MTVAGVSVRSSLIARSLVNMRSQLTDLQRQLATGKKSDTYAGLGLQRGLSVSLRSQLSQISDYVDTITSVGVRIDLAQTVFSRISDVGLEIKAAANQMGTTNGHANSKITAQSAVGEILGLLNTRAGDRYIFSGMAADQPAVESTDHIMNGDGARAGLTQIVNERNQADLGAGQNGRLVITNPTATSVQVAEDLPGSIFGFKLDSISSNVTGATLTGPAGAPPAMSIDLAAIPNAGETVSLVFDLPDGTTETLTLTATTSTTPGPLEFEIGGDPIATRVNLQAKIDSAVGTLARTALAAASALMASAEFFTMDAANPPQRVDGPPATATGLVAGTSANTVFWYTGEAGPQSARSTATARIDQSIALDYGLRANEEGIRWQLQNIAALATISMSPTDPNSAARGAALADRLRPALDTPPGTQSIEDIQSELATVQASMLSAKQRHRLVDATLSDMLQSIEGISNEEVGAQILALQTSLQASLQTTSILYQTSILDYL